MGRTTYRAATWAPAEAAPRAGFPRLCRRFADDRELVRFKLMLLAGFVVLTAALERVV